MATITINLDDELNEKFRNIIKQKILTATKATTINLPNLSAESLLNNIPRIIK